SRFRNFLMRRDRFRWTSDKNRHGAKQSFTLTGAVHVKDRAIRLPTFGWVKLKERGYLPRSRVLYATVSKRAGRWFVSVGVRREKVRVPENDDGPVAGVDWGIIHPATVSDGTTLERPRLERLKWRRGTPRRPSPGRRREARIALSPSSGTRRYGTGLQASAWTGCTS